MQEDEVHDPYEVYHDDLYNTGSEEQVAVCMDGFVRAKGNHYFEGETVFRTEVEVRLKSSKTER